MKRKLEEALKRRFPDEDVKLLAKILRKAVEKDSIFYEEVDVPEEVKEDLLFFLVNERLLLPDKIWKTLAWDERIFMLKNGEKYFMPNVVKHLIKKAEETGEWDPEYAVEEYLREIREREKEKITTLFRRIKEKLRFRENRLTPEFLKETIDELGLDLNVEKVIIEFKGGGIISPHLRDSIRSKQLKYEVNPSCLDKN
ncbi:hypothetical protein CW703_05920 [Candidatus Bathyarchaeota archaeon]|nr:MAG: hypothetical protein CW703_05920 [Candidatus Bathyarchaeota archaeon]